MNDSRRSSHDIRTDPATRAVASLPFNTHMHRVIEPVLALPVGSDILDAGCGGGAVARWLATQGRHHVLGIDLDLPDRAETGGPQALPDGGSLELRGPRAPICWAFTATGSMTGSCSWASCTTGGALTPSAG